MLNNFFNIPLSTEALCNKAYSNENNEKLQKHHDNFQNPCSQPRADIEERNNTGVLWQTKNT